MYEKERTILKLKYDDDHLVDQFIITIKLAKKVKNYWRLNIEEIDYETLKNIKTTSGIVLDKFDRIRKLSKGLLTFDTKEVTRENKRIIKEVNRRRTEKYSRPQMSKRNRRKELAIINRGNSKSKGR